MGKEKKCSNWMVFLRGGTVALLVYLVGVFVFALLVTKGGLPEHMVVWLIAALGFISAGMGSSTAIKSSTLASVPAGLLNAFLFLLFLALIGIIGWPETIRSSRSVICGAAVLSGGLVSGFSGTGKRQRKKKRRKRSGTK